MIFLGKMFITRLNIIEQFQQEFLTILKYWVWINQFCFPFSEELLTFWINDKINLTKRNDDQKKVLNFFHDINLLRFPAGAGTSSRQNSITLSGWSQSPLRISCVLSPIFLTGSALSVFRAFSRNNQKFLIFFSPNRLTAPSHSVRIRIAVRRCWGMV